MEVSLAFEQKEDLRLRMADLEKKLSESEEERCKLEKTCDVLMRAFKEEEKMRYKALNKKYEKFLEDCTVRKRRNDIILRSLCRIEDRSKVLFAKTERLKLLKDRYISYLKINDVKKDEYQPWKTTPLTSHRTSDFTSNQITWKTPLATYNRDEIHVRDLISRNGSFRTEAFRPDKSEELQRNEVEIRDRTGFSNLTHTEIFRRDGRDKFNLAESSLGLQEQLVNDKKCEPGNSEINAEKFVSNIGNKCQELSEAAASKERGIISHQESVEKLKKTLMSEGSYLDNDDDPFDIVEKDRTEENEKQNDAHDELIPRINHNLVISSPVRSIYREKQKLSTKNEVENKPSSPADYEEENLSSHNLPRGLDGVDYDNETYPESYYEQPAHHNHVSIASDVILEEDESEQDLEEENISEAPPLKDPGRNESWVKSPVKTSKEAEMKVLDKREQTDETNKGHHVEEVETQESEKSAGSKPTSADTEGSKTDRSEIFAPGKPNKSNLIHLLESDSESFQIEHGDAVSGNEDSEFDFSFGQN